MSKPVFAAMAFALFFLSGCVPPRTNISGTNAPLTQEGAYVQKHLDLLDHEVSVRTFDNDKNGVMDIFIFAAGGINDELLFDAAYAVEVSAPNYDQVVLYTNSVAYVASIRQIVEVNKSGGDIVGCWSKHQL